MKVLAGDVGGTKTLLLVAEVQDVRCRTLHQKRYPSQSYESLDDMVETFLRSAPPAVASGIETACFGIAGPIKETAGEQTAALTNLPWRVGARTLRERLRIRRVILINDFQAIAIGIRGLTEDDLTPLQRGEPDRQAPQLVVGAGTGLGVAQILTAGGHTRVLPSEGGHVSFAPQDELQAELLRYWRRRTGGRVSWERVVSGPGLVSLYEFLHERREGEAARLREVLAAEDPAAAIAVAADAGTDSLAEEALELFLGLYGAVVGDLALVTLPFGGVYVAGGIAPKLLKRLSSGAFLSAFNRKGRMHLVAERIPISVVTNPQVGLLGAALAAAH